MPPPRALCAAAEVVLNADLRRAFEDEEFSSELIEALLGESRSQGISLDEETLEYALRRSLEQMVDRLAINPTDLEMLKKSDEAVGILPSLPFQVNLWKVQNIFYDLLQTVYPGWRERAHQGDEKARKWIRHFSILGERLSVRVE